MFELVCSNLLSTQCIPLGNELLYLPTLFMLFSGLQVTGAEPQRVWNRACYTFCFQRSCFLIYYFISADKWQWLSEHAISGFSNNERVKNGYQAFHSSILMLPSHGRLARLNGPWDNPDRGLERWLLYLYLPPSLTDSLPYNNRRLCCASGLLS